MSHIEELERRALIHKQAASLLRKDARRHMREANQLQDEIEVLKGNTLLKKIIHILLLPISLPWQKRGNR
jgi:hypothetical protein